MSICTNQCHWMFTLLDCLPAIWMIRSQRATATFQTKSVSSCKWWSTAKSHNTRLALIYSPPKGTSCASLYLQNSLQHSIFKNKYIYSQVVCIFTATFFLLTNNSYCNVFPFLLLIVLSLFFPLFINSTTRWHEKTIRKRHWTGLASQQAADLPTGQLGPFLLLSPWYLLFSTDSATSVAPSKKASHQTRPVYCSSS